MNKQTFRLVHQQARQLAAKACMEAEDGFMVTISQPARNLEQNAKLHVMIDDISTQALFMDKEWEAENWKRLLLDAFARIKASEGEPLKGGFGKIVPNLDHSGFVQLGVQSRGLRKKEASEFIEYLFAFGAMQEPQVTWSKNYV